MRNPVNGTSARPSIRAVRPGLRALLATLVVGMAVPAPIAPPAPVQAAATPDAAPVEQARAAYARLPLAFAPNAGQTDPQVRYVAQSQGAVVFLTPAEAVLALSPAQTEGRPGLALRMQFAGAASPQLTPAAELPGTVNFLTGAAGHTGLPAYGQVRYQSVAPGVDLAFSGTPGRLRSIVTVQPGADLSAFALRYAGAERLEADGAGGLALHVGGGELHSPRPAAWQEVGGERRPVEARYALHGNSSAGFELGPHDAGYPVTLEPELVYSTYLGGNNNDSGLGIAVDPWGHAYVTGETPSSDFPVTAGSFQRSNGGSFDAFVTKLSRDGSALVYSTYLGGSGLDRGHSIAVDRWGHAYVTGDTTSTNFPVTAGAFQPRHAGGVRDVFVTKLSRDGSALVYSTYLGGTGNDIGQGIAVDAWDHAFITGETFSPDFPVTPGAFQMDLRGSRDAFVTRFSRDGATLVSSTYLGGDGLETGFGIAADARGNASVTGYTDSTDFPTRDAVQPVFGGGLADAFVSKLNARGSALVYSTYLGGSSDDFGRGIAVDPWGNAAVTGDTASEDFPTRNAVQPVFGGGVTDAFVSKLDAHGSALVYSTYLGGSDRDSGQGIAVDPWGKASVTGYTDSTDFPTRDAVQPVFGGVMDAFVTKLSKDGSKLLSSTYLGGVAEDRGQGIAVDRWGNAYVTGRTRSPDFPITAGAFQPDGGGDSDAFVTKIGTDGY